MDKKKKILLSVLGILLLVLVTVGVTVALFTYTKLGTTENTITTGTLKFLYTENTGVGNGINITNAFPVSDQVGKTYNTENYVFDFKVEATNTGNEAIPYEVTLRKKSDSTLNANNVKIYLTDMTGDADTELVAPTLYSDLEQTSIDVGNEVEKTLYEGTVNGGELTYKKNFRLRMWIKENADYNEIGGKTFTALVNVYSNAPLVSAEEIASRSSTEIKSISIGDINATKVEGQDYDYDLVLDKELNSVIINVETKNVIATVDSIEKIDSLTYDDSNIKRLASSEAFPIVLGYNYFKITVTSGDKTATAEYKLRVKLPEFYTLFEKEFVLNENPTLTNSIDNTSDASGLYRSVATNDGSPTYYFRGIVEGNYIDFAGFTWRVVRVNEDGTIRIIMQDGIDDDKQYVFNSNVNNKDYMYYTNSESKTTLETWYQENIVAKGYSDKVATPNNYFCEQAKVVSDSTYATNSGVDMLVYSDYTPNFMCSNDANNRGIVNTSIGMLTYDEAVHAGGYYNQANENYYLHNATGWWLMSPAGFSSNDRANTWRIHDTSYVGNYDAFATFALRPVINLKADTTVTGEGTADSHWIVQ